MKTTAPLLSGFRLWRTFFLWPLLFLASVSFLAGASKMNEPVAKISAEEIETKLAMFYATFVNVISATVERQGASDADLNRLRRLTLVKIRVVRACRSTVFQANPRNALIDTWALCIQYKFSLEGEFGAREFGADATALLAAASRMQREIEGVAADVLSPEEAGAVGLQLENFYREHTSTITRTFAAPSGKEIQAGIPNLGWLFNLPLAPFRAMAGVDSTAQALTDLGRTTEKLTHIAASLPLEISWESEMLLLQARRDSAALVQASIEQAGTQGRALIDHLFWRGIELIAALLGASLIYRLLTARLWPTLPANK